MARKKKVTYEMHGIDMTGGAYESMSKERLAALAAHEAKIANQRMRRLEAAGFGGDNPISQAWRIVTSDISRWFPDAKKFSEAKGVYEKKRRSTIIAILRDFEYYKTLKTATVQGTKKVMKSRKEAFEKKTGLKFKNQAQYDRFWKSGVGKYLWTALGSGVALDYLKLADYSSSKPLDNIIKDVKKFMRTDDGTDKNADAIVKEMGFKDLQTARGLLKAKKAAEAAPTPTKPKKHTKKKKKSKKKFRYHAKG